jgi:hypothetical protein
MKEFAAFCVRSAISSVFRAPSASEAVVSADWFTATRRNAAAGGWGFDAAVVRFPPVPFIEASSALSERNFICHSGAGAPAETPTSRRSLSNPSMLTSMVQTPSGKSAKWKAP